MMNNSIKDIFNKHFNYLPDKSYFSPGRVNIIGGHTDYNGGAVLPFCINLGIYGAITFRNDSMINVYSHNFSRLGGISFDLEKSPLYIFAAIAAHHSQSLESLWTHFPQYFYVDFIGTCGWDYSYI